MLFLHAAQYAFEYLEYCIAGYFCRSKFWLFPSQKNSPLVCRSEWIINISFFRASGIEGRPGSPSSVDGVEKVEEEEEAESQPVTGIGKVYFASV